VPPEHAVAKSTEGCLEEFKVGNLDLEWLVSGAGKLRTDSAAVLDDV
jgi:hypothetical protein